ncbi:unnamed protein product, partial [Owenia fusiformis]
PEMAGKFENSEFVYSSLFYGVLASLGTALFVKYFLKYSGLYRASKEPKALCIFSRYPQPGKAKTRMIPLLGKDGAAKLQIIMTERMVEQCSDLKQCASQMWYNGGSRAQMQYWLSKTGGDLNYIEQIGNTLGDKMANAFRHNFKRGKSKVVIIGSDIPDISDAIIEEAFSTLDVDGHHMVIGQARDGGYYLVGLHVSALPLLDAGLFEGMEWGTSAVFQQQCQVANQLGAKLKILPNVLCDVDTPEDIRVFEKATGVTEEELSKPTWSVIIPVLNEAQNIEKTLNAVIQRHSNRDMLEIIISDGGSRDATVEIVETFAQSSSVKMTVVNSSPGRGPQLKCGAEAATGSYMLFLHADCLPPNNYDQVGTAVLMQPGVVAGAFTFALDVNHPDSPDHSTLFKWQMRLIAFTVKFRCKYFEFPYGDQGLFMSHHIYNKVGGYPAYPLMEDYAMVEKLLQKGHVLTTQENAVLNSRRWQKHGFFKVTLINTVIITAYRHFGVSPETLARWYYGPTK